MFYEGKDEYFQRNGESNNIELVGSQLGELSVTLWTIFNKVLQVQGQWAEKGPAQLKWSMASQSADNFLSILQRENQNLSSLSLKVTDVAKLLLANSCVWEWASEPVQETFPPCAPPWDEGQTPTLHLKLHKPLSAFFGMQQGTA